MAAQANIVAFDGAAAPVSHTLVPEGLERLPDGTSVARWKESLPGVPDYAQIRFTVSKRKTKNGIFVVTKTTEVPVMETVNLANSSGYTAPPKVAYTDTEKTIGYFHERGVVTGRRLARQLHINIMGSIATTVATVATGPVPELDDQLIMPT